MECCKKKFYVEQPKGFIDPHRSDDVYKLKRALYGLKQAPRAWYDRLTAISLSMDSKGDLQTLLSL